MTPSSGSPSPHANFFPFLAYFLIIYLLLLLLLIIIVEMSPLLILYAIRFAE